MFFVGHKPEEKNSRGGSLGRVFLGGVLGGFSGGYGGWILDGAGGLVF